MSTKLATEAVFNSFQCYDRSVHIAVAMDIAELHCFSVLKHMRHRKETNREVKSLTLDRDFRHAPRPLISSV